MNPVSGCSSDTSCILRDRKPFHSNTCYSQFWASCSLAIINFLFCTFLTFLYPTLGYAQTHEIIEYEYDGAGNITGIRTAGQNQGLPDVFNFIPGHIHRETITVVDAIGENLFNVNVTTETPGVSILATEQISAELIKLTVFASTAAAIGSAVFEFTTRLGRDTESLLIAERVPIISTDPNPIVLLSDSSDRLVTLAFDQPFTTDQPFDLLITNSDIAESDVQSVLLPAGDREVALIMRGLSQGNTSLEITQSANFLALSVPIIVSDPFNLPADNTIFNSRPLGVTVSRFNLPQGNQFFRSEAVGVVVSRFDLPPLETTFVSDSLGVLRNASEFELPAGSTTQVSSIVGAVIPPYVQSKSSDLVLQNSTITLTLVGVDLDLVTSINLVPDSGITQTAPFVVNPAGTELQLFLQVSATSTLGSRQIVLREGTEPVPFLSPGTEQLEIAAN